MVPDSGCGTAGSLTIDGTPDPGFRDPQIGVQDPTVRMGTGDYGIRDNIHTSRVSANTTDLHIMSNVSDPARIGGRDDDTHHRSGVPDLHVRYRYRLVRRSDSG